MCQSGYTNDVISDVINSRSEAACRQPYVIQHLDHVTWPTSPPPYVCHWLLRAVVGLCHRFLTTRLTHFPSSRLPRPMNFISYSDSGVKEKYCDKACLSVCVSVCRTVHVCWLAYLRNHMAECHQNVLQTLPAYDRGSVIFWWRYNTLCISGFVDGVILLYNGPDRGMSLPQQPCAMQCTS